MTFKIEYKTKTEEMPVEENKIQEIELLEINVHTDYPNTPIEIILDDGSAFGAVTDEKGVSTCSTSIIKNYHVTVNINGETFEENIII